MISKYTPPGTLVVCIANGPVSKTFSDIEVPVVNGYYTIEQIGECNVPHLFTLKDPNDAIYVWLKEIPSQHRVVGGVRLRIGYVLDWFRLIDRQVDEMENADIRVGTGGNVLVPDVAIAEMMLDLLMMEGSQDDDKE